MRKTKNDLSYDEAKLDTVYCVAKKEKLYQSNPEITSGTGEVENAKI